jgi:predicted nucleic acid-binding protein
VKAVFVDTSFYLALLVPEDRWHEEALRLSKEVSGRRVTSEFVLCELGALLSAPRNRALFLEFVDLLDVSELTDVLPATQADFRAGLELFSTRPDKEWSLTDCISFGLMGRSGISSALTFAHHFEQAGFNLLKPDHLDSGN